MTFNVKIVIACLLLLFSEGLVFEAPERDAHAGEARHHVSFIPQWIPQAQFAGYYVAYKKGFYERYGLDVDILPGGPESPSAKWITKGAADFGTMFLSTGILERAKGTKLVNIGQIVGRSTQLLIAKKSSGISTFKDMNGKKVGLWGVETSILPEALFKKYGLQVTVVPQTSSVSLFLRGGVDVVSAMWYNEYHSLYTAGLDPEELLVFNLSEHGLNVPEDGIYCLEDTFRKNPEVGCRFVQASLEGWRYAFDHPEEALDIVMSYVDEAKIATNRLHQRWMLDRMRDVIDVRKTSTPQGNLLESDYQNVAGELRESGLIDNIPSYSNFFVNCTESDEK